MLDQKQIKELDKAYRKQAKHRVRLRSKDCRSMEGTLTEKLVTPSGANVLSFSDGSETVSVLVSAPIYERCSVGQKREITYSGHSLLGVGPSGSSAARAFEEHTVSVTIRTRGEACEMTDEEIAEWYRNAIDSLLDPHIGEHEVSVRVERRPL